MTKNLRNVKIIDVFDFDSPNEILKHFVAYSTSQGVSLRELTRQCGLSSPNYFQKVIGENRHITVQSASKIADALGLTSIESEYWMTLVKIALPQFKNKKALLSEAQSLKERARRKKTQATEIHEHWIHSVIFEMAKIKDFDMSIQNIHSRIRKYTSLLEVERSLMFLLKHKWLVPTNTLDRYNQAAVEFDPLYDRRSIDMLTVHGQHLDMAKHRLNDDAKETEFLGLTTAIPFNKMPEVQKIMRQAMDEIEFKIATSSDCDNVIIIHMSAFRVTD